MSEFMIAIVKSLKEILISLYMTIILFIKNKKN